MHADVGGGYGDDRLSYIPLQWMLGHASRSAGLRLRVELFEEFYENTGVAGVMHDSRRGLASFYRYKPRTWERLHCQDMDGNGNPEVKVERFLIDQSIFDRIKASGADYAPVGIPEDYDVVTWARQPGGTLVETVQSAAQAGLESPGQRSTRASLQDAALDLIFWRQLLYYLMLAIALTLMIVPLLWLPNPSLISSGLPSQIVGIIAAVLEYTPVPKASQIGLFWKQHAPSFLLLAGTFVLAWGISAGLGKRIQSIAQGAWRHLVDPAHIAKAPPVNSWIRFWRSRNAGIHRVWTKRALPLITVLVLFVVLPLMPVWRWYLFRPLGGESVCTVAHANGPVLQPVAPGAKIAFDTRMPCLNTGIELKQGRIYSLKVEVNSPWKDLNYNASPAGLVWITGSFSDWFASLGPRLKMRSLSFMRRYWTEDWFALMGSIGRSREYAFRIEARPVQGSGRQVWTYRFQAWRSGRLYLFVNDAIRPSRPAKDKIKGKSAAERSAAILDEVARYYSNNSGTATITVEESAEL
jgi:hypothetical protein